MTIIPPVAPSAPAGPLPAPPPAAADDVRLARAYLSRVAEAPAPGLAGLVEEVGPLQAAELVRCGPAAGLRDDVFAEVAARYEEDRAAADLAAIEAYGGRLVVPEDPEWPTATFAAFRRAKLRDAGLRAPLALWVRGSSTLDRIGWRSVSVVGARAASDYGLWVARDWGAAFGNRGVPVVSGAALGIDAGAHRGALAADGVTVAVLACGIDRPYPPTHVRLLEHVAAAGAVVSEYPPGFRPFKGRFLVRNRLIAALSGGTLLVEAAARSGARRTATVALHLGRPVMAVPGPVTSPMSVGCHQLVRERGAELVGRPDEVIELVGRIGEDLAPDEVKTVRPTDGLSAEALAVYDALPVHAAHDERRLARDSGVDPSVISTRLSDLEISGHAEYLKGGWRRRPE